MNVNDDARFQEDLIALEEYHTLRDSIQRSIDSTFDRLMNIRLRLARGGFEYVVDYQREKESLMEGLGIAYNNLNRVNGSVCEIHNRWMNYEIP